MSFVPLTTFLRSRFSSLPSPLSNIDRVSFIKPIICCNQLGLFCNTSHWWCNKSQWATMHNNQESDWTWPNMWFEISTRTSLVIIATIIISACCVVFFFFAKSGWQTSLKMLIKWVTKTAQRHKGIPRELSFRRLGVGILNNLAAKCSNIKSST